MYGVKCWYIQKILLEVPSYILSPEICLSFFPSFSFLPLLLLLLLLLLLSAAAAAYRGTTMHVVVLDTLQNDRR